MCLYICHVEEGSFIVQLNKTYSGLLSPSVLFRCRKKKTKFTIRTCSNISGVCDHVSASTVQWQQPLRGQGPVSHRTAWLDILLQRVNTYFQPTPVSVHDCVNCEGKKKQRNTDNKRPNRAEETFGVSVQLI